MRSFAQTPSNNAEERARELLARLSPEERVGQLFLVSFQGREVGSNTPIYRLITRYHVGGVILSAANDNFTGPEGTVAQTAALIRNLQQVAWDATQSPSVDARSGQPLALTYIPLFVGISQEGDLYPNDQIFNGMTPLPSAMAIGATWKPALAEQVGQVLGKELYALGFNLYLGPSLDVLDVPNLGISGEDLGTRTFGGDPYWVGEMGKAFIRGVHAGSNGRIAVIAKHFPGQGSSDRSPEEEVATVRKSLEQLKQVELAPFFAVTQTLPGDPVSPDGVLVSHIRYQGFQGNIRASTRPISLDAAALEQLLKLEPIGTWYQGGGLIISDNLGSNAVKRFFDPTGQNFDPRLVARTAFLAGNDLLYLNNFVGSGDTDAFDSMAKTLDAFVQKYLEDPAFAERVDASVLRILTLKYRLYPSFALEDVIPEAIALNEVGRSQSTVFEVARQSITLLSPDAADLSEVLPRPPAPREGMIFFTDVESARQCSTCPEQSVFTVDGLKKAIVRLYGPQAGGQINEAYLSAYSFQDLTAYLNGAQELVALDNNLRQAEWVIFSILNPRRGHPEANALRRLLAERPDLIRNKRVIVFAFNAPYYLDATDISKLTAYYAVYSKTAPFLDMAARVLFQEVVPVGASPVSVPGIGYDLITITSPDPAQVIPIIVEPLGSEGATVVPSAPQTTESPSFKLGDVISIRTGLIYDHNRNPVPDGTVVRFIITTGIGDKRIQQQVETVTNRGIAQTTYKITEASPVEIRAVSDPALLSQIITINITDGQEAAVTAVLPTLIPTETPEVTVTPVEVTPTPTLEPAAPRHASPPLGLWVIVLVLVWGLGLGVGGIAARALAMRLAYQQAMFTVIGGMIAYIVVLLLPDPRNGYLRAGLPGILVAILFGCGIGWALGRLWQVAGGHMRTWLEHWLGINESE
ncbi:glycoside hydrolase family 3 N-terminal domain-containing protein [uncultured Thermanaerothrix sp.]|uniref:glycoside hydrolase family 3 N-terminal domain-containing protein n=1 Tax=uncultured Thermanaerothrix sp. TaxID=1195149 RepID=UPI002604D2BB|nr:glycoside hydrolase family 3 N-terminal domain-containing protein [uncultured Thermanaerothrix sp.]